MHLDVAAERHPGGARRIARRAHLLLVEAAQPVAGVAIIAVAARRVERGGAGRVLLRALAGRVEPRLVGAPVAAAQLTGPVVHGERASQDVARAGAAL